MSREPYEAAIEGDVVKKVIFLAIIRLHLKDFFTVCTALSTCPLYEGWKGAVLLCITPHLSRNSSKSEEVKRRPMTESRTFVKPNVVNIFRTSLTIHTHKYKTSCLVVR